MTHISIPKIFVEEILRHLERGNHDRLGKCHKVYSSPDKCDIEMGTMPCNYGLLLPGVRGRKSFSARENERIERSKANECTCGYSEIVEFLRQVLADTEGT